jgi:hypothetical protein
MLRASREEARRRIFPRLLMFQVVYGLGFDWIGLDCVFLGSVARYLHLLVVVSAWEWEVVSQPPIKNFSGSLQYASQS